MRIDLKAIFFVLGIFSNSYGLTRATILPVLVKRQNAAFEEYVRSLAADYIDSIGEDSDSAIWEMPEDMRQLRQQLHSAAGMYPGWPQAIAPTAIGIILFFFGIFAGEKQATSRKARVQE